MGHKRRSGPSNTSSSNPGWESYASWPTNRPGVRRPAHEEARRSLLVTPSEGQVRGKPLAALACEHERHSFPRPVLELLVDDLIFGFLLGEEASSPRGLRKISTTIKTKPLGNEVGPLSDQTNGDAAKAKPDLTHATRKQLTEHPISAIEVR